MPVDKQASYPNHCVMIPFLNRLDQVAACLNSLLLQALPNTVFLLIDDGSTPQALHSMPLQPMLSLPNVYLIHHKDNYGVSAARNSGYSRRASSYSRSSRLLRKQESGLIAASITAIPLLNHKR